MDTRLRKTGIDAIGDVPWGTHICVFYKSKEELLDILLPYFSRGLQHNEYCVWAVADSLTLKEAKQALGRQVKNLGAYIAKGQMEIVKASDWYTVGGRFNPERVLQAWVEKETYALKKGFYGMRVAGNISELPKDQWERITDYESRVNNAITEHQAIVICAYDIGRLMISQILQTGASHQFIVSKHKKRWNVVKAKAFKNIKEEITRV